MFMIACCMGRELIKTNFDTVFVIALKSVTLRLFI